MNETTSTTRPKNLPDGIQPLISGTATPYHSLYTGTAGFLCYLAGAVFTLAISVFLIIFMIVQSNPWGVMIVLLFICTGTLLGCIVSILRVVKIAKNRPTREQNRALEFGQVTDARIVELVKKQKRMRSGGSAGAFYTAFYNIKYEYTDAAGNKQSGQYRFDVSELFDPHFIEGGSIAVAFIDGDSIPVESYQIAQIDDKDKIDDVRLRVPPTVKGKLRPIDDSTRHNRLGWMLAIVAAGMYLLIAVTLLIVLDLSSQDTIGKIYLSILICGTEGGVGIIPTGYAVKNFRAVHAQRAKFKRLLARGTLSYAAVKYTRASTLYNQFSIYVYRNGDDLACGAIASRRLDSEIANILVGYLAPPYIKMLVLFSDTESLPVYEK
ncbi:MAG: hypothetical protein K2M89_00185 [Clostridiales bacterium]|nr:hypothetical protein [Clostridiales bacterium]